MKYKVNEIFYSLKGEGRWTGTPMSFIRLSGCNLRCEFCDTDHSKFEELNTQEILRRIKQYPSYRVVLTGGEPLMQDCRELIHALNYGGYHVHLETNGMFEIPEEVAWVAISPKNRFCDEEAVGAASEIKFLVGGTDWLKLLEGFMNTYMMEPKPYLYVMPIAKSIKIGNRTITDIISENVQQAIEYCKAHPEFSLCMQMHKVVDIP